MRKVSSPPKIKGELSLALYHTRHKPVDQFVVTGCAPQTEADWQRRQDATVKALQAVLGDVPGDTETPSIVKGYADLPKD